MKLVNKQIRLTWFNNIKGEYLLYAVKRKIRIGVGNQMWGQIRDPLRNVIDEIN